MVSWFFGKRILSLFHDAPPTLIVIWRSDYRAPESADRAAAAPEAADAQQPLPAANSPNSGDQQFAPDSQDTIHEDEFGSGDAFQPWSRSGRQTLLDLVSLVCASLLGALP